MYALASRLAVPTEFIKVNRAILLGHYWRRTRTCRATRIDFSNDSSNFTRGLGANLATLDCCIAVHWPLDNMFTANRRVLRYEYVTHVGCPFVEDMLGKCVVVWKYLIARK